MSTPDSFEDPASFEDPGSFEDIVMRGASVQASIARLLRACLVAACLCWPLVPFVGAAAAAALPEALAGDWRGTVEIADGEAVGRAVLRQRGDGFEVDIRLPEVPPLRAQLVPSDQPRVFQVAAARRGLFGFFDGGDRSDPFDGEPLIWARSSAVGIVVYRLTIATDGGTALLRVAFEPADEGLAMAVERRIDAAPRVRYDVLLEPAG